MNKTGIVLILGAVMILGGVGFYIWDHNVRPEQEAKAAEAKAALKACDVHSAARAGDLKMLEKLYAAGCSVNKRDDFDMTPLHVAQNDRIATYLLDHGAIIDARDGRGFTPMKVMEMAGRTDVIAVLKARGAKE